VLKPPKQRSAQVQFEQQGDTDDGEVEESEEEELEEEL
jgi:hypothetical protein